ncbi:succinyl-diaminopimelate desuccinylase [Marinivivus vitaminiproducens]|uniref:succinyl-diaminopimelate desuccinylase n=1 Tax=Marinivivus vitaminiproducens TaxID=3035935 RepID=UPI0027A6C757|nr:succinyl-diaminopimelate desuccinylase [Geminicoccaceae bacterium SCSIO 64248]
MDATDPLAIAAGLIRCPSVTPDQGGALDLLQALLEPLGAVCHRLTFQKEGTAAVENLYARIGTAAPHLAFAGHVDVVPPGDEAAWSVPPFAAEIRDGWLIGRGACDMKGGIACFVAAVARHVRDHGSLPGSVSFLITADEEGDAINGTAALVDWLRARGETIDACLVGEPTNPSALGEVAKVGRRGSLNGTLTVHGRQGHTAYPERADNPVPRLLAMLDALMQPLDGGTDAFQPSHLEITTIDVGNPARNVIPARAVAGFNVRFNDRFTASTLDAELRERCAGIGGGFDLVCTSGAEAFRTEPGPLSRELAQAIDDVVGRRPELNTLGGTSDARFIKDIAPVIEFGLVGQSMHAVDERVAVADLGTLTAIYGRFLDRYLTGRR